MGKLPDMLVNILLDQADLDRSQDINYDEFVLFCKQYPLYSKD